MLLPLGSPLSKLLVKGYCRGMGPYLIALAGDRVKAATVDSIPGQDRANGHFSVIPTPMRTRQFLSIASAACAARTKIASCAH